MKPLLLPLGILLCSAYQATGQALIYHPANPAFGGNTFNYSWLQSSAQAQDKIKDPNASQSTLGQSRTVSSPLTDFASSLQRQLLNRLTTNLINQQFGETDIKEGTYKFGEFQVEVTNASDGVQVRIVDGSGGETIITVPYY